jgi:Domain of unknown function (DUF4160)
MPTVLVFQGLDARIYTNDYRPAHVHVVGGGCEAKFQLNCPDGPVEMVENFGFSRRQARQILEALQEALGYLCEEWRRIHGI